MKLLYFVRNIPYYLCCDTTILTLHTIKILIIFKSKKWIYFPVWLRNQLLSAGLEPVLSQTENSCIASNYRQFSKNIKINHKNNTNFLSQGGKLPKYDVINIYTSLGVKYGLVWLGDKGNFSYGCFLIKKLRVWLFKIFHKKTSRAFYSFLNVWRQIFTNDP